MADNEWGGVGDDDENEEEETEYQDNYGKDGLIFLIDCTKSMFDNETGETPFQLCMKCARNVMANKIISSEKDVIGIVFFGTKEFKNSGSFKNIYVFQDLEQPGANGILEVEKLMTKDCKKLFEKKYGHSNDFSLSDTLWACSAMFSSSSVKLGNKRVLLFTATDDPHAGSAQMQRQAKQKARDLFESGTELDLMHLQPSGKTFDVGKFYQDLIFLSDDEECGKMPDASEKFEELLTRVRTKDHKKRTLGRVQFSLADGLSLGVGIYNLARPLTKPSPVILAKASNAELKSIRKSYLKDTGEILTTAHIRKYQVFGGKKIMFDQEEMKQVNQFFEPGITLMGFKPASCLERYYYMKPSSFLYPDEKSVTGSTTIFAALLQRCVDRHIVPICRYTPRRNNPPRFVALLPQMEELGPNNVQTTPPGFHVVHLPFADDFRQLQFDDPVRANEEQIEKAKEIVKKLQFKFASEAFENPVLQTHWKNIEALALDRDEPDETVDYTKPNIEVMEKRAGKLIDEFKNLVFPEDYDPTPTAKGKRKQAGGDESAAKRGKAADKIANVDVKVEAQLGRLEKLTVDILKAFCSTVGIKTTGLKKGQLIDSINQHLKIDC